jgi:anti-anti-sigma factor
MGPAFDIEIARRSDAVVLSLVGELDLASARWFDDQLTLALASNAQRVIVGLERLTFIDAHGLRTLMRYACSREYGDRVEIESPSFPVQRMLALTGVDQLRVTTRAESAA